MDVASSEIYKDGKYDLASENKKTYICWTCRILWKSCK
jgi:enolase